MPCSVVQSKFDLWKFNHSLNPSQNISQKIDSGVFFPQILEQNVIFSLLRNFSAEDQTRFVTVEHIITAGCSLITVIAHTLGSAPPYGFTACV